MVLDFGRVTNLTRPNLGASTHGVYTQRGMSPFKGQNVMLGRS